ncbi:MAG: 8-amino-7-oxononanoate synthase [Pseudomonadota bacterium]
MTHDKLVNYLKTLQSKGVYRTRKNTQTQKKARVIVQHKTLINFCSNDYLGLSVNETVIRALQTGAEKFGAGSGSAHLICGHSNAHHALEEELADFTGRERSLLFSTGYMANLGAITALCQHGDHIFEDKLNHASLLDGGLFSGAKFRRYPHNDTARLSQLIGATTEGEKLIVTDGVFSMDGDVADLKTLSNIARKNAAWLMVDDAHGLGVLGKTGGGLVEASQLSTDDVPILMGTLGKAFGTFGAFIAGSDTLVETLIQSARTYIYTTALPPAIAQATRASLKIVIEETWRREKLQDLITKFKIGAEQLHLPLMPSDSPIQPLLVGDSVLANQMSEKLFEAGFLVSAIRPPTVPQGKARLRITLSALHEEEDLHRLLDTLALIHQSCSYNAK